MNVELQRVLNRINAKNQKIDLALIDDLKKSINDTYTNKETSSVKDLDKLLSKLRSTYISFEREGKAMVKAWDKVESIFRDGNAKRAAIKKQIEKYEATAKELGFNPNDSSVLLEAKRAERETVEALLLWDDIQATWDQFYDKVKNFL